MSKGCVAGIALVAVFAFVGCQDSSDHLSLQASLSADQGSVLEVNAEGTSVPVVLSFELNQEAGRDLSFLVWSEPASVVVHEPAFVIERGTSRHLIEVLPNLDGTPRKEDQTVTVYVSGAGLTASFQILVTDRDPVWASVAPAEVSLVEAGPESVMTLTLSQPATEQVDFLLENPAPMSLLAPGMVSLLPGETSVSFVVRAVPDPNAIDEVVVVPLRQVNGTDLSVELGTAFTVSITDDDVVDGFTSSGDEPSVTLAGADTLWESGLPRGAETVTLVLKPTPPEAVAFQVGTTDPDALAVLDLATGLPRSLFTIVPGAVAESATVSFVVAALQDPDKTHELATLYAFSVVGGEDPNNQNPSSGAYANLVTTRSIRLVDDDLLSLSLVRLSHAASDTLEMAGIVPLDTAAYRVQILGGVAPSGGIRVKVRSSDLNLLGTYDATGSAFVTELFIPADSEHVDFLAIPHGVYSGNPSQVLVSVEGILGFEVEDISLLDSDLRVIRHVAGELLQLSLRTGTGQDSLLVEGDAADGQVWVVAELSGNLTLGSLSLGIGISDPNVAWASESQLHFAYGQTADSFLVTALADPDYLHETFEVRLFGGQGGQLLSEALTLRVADDDSTLAFLPHADVEMFEGESLGVTIQLNRAVQVDYGDLELRLTSSDPSRVQTRPTVVTIAELEDGAEFGLVAPQHLGTVDAEVEIRIEGTELGQTVAQVIRVHVADDDTTPVLTFLLDGTPSWHLWLTESSPSDSFATVTARLSGATGPLQLGLEVSDPEKAMADTNALVFESGETEKSFVLRALPDADWYAERLEVRLLGGTGGQVIQGVLTVDVAEADGLLTASLTPSSGMLGEGETASVLLSLSQPVPTGYGALSFLLTSSDPAHLATIPGQVVVAEESDTVSFLVVGLANEGFELPQAVSVTAAGGGYGQLVQAASQWTVVDADGPPALLLERAGGNLGTLSEAGDSTLVRVSLLNVGTPTHAPVELSVGVSDPGVLAPDTAHLSFAADSYAESFWVHTVPDLDFADEQASVTVSGTMHGISVAELLVLSVADDDTLLLGGFVPPLSEIGEGETLAVVFELNQPVPAGGGPLQLTLFSTDASALAPSGDSFGFSLAEGDTAVAFRLVGVEDADLEDEEVLVYLGGTTVGGWSLQHVAPLTLRDDDRFRFGWILSSQVWLLASPLDPEIPWAGWAMDTLSVFLTAAPPEGDSVQFLIYPEDFDGLELKDLESGDFELTHFLHGLGETLRIGLTPRPVEIDRVVAGDPFDVLAGFSAIANEVREVVIQASWQTVVENHRIPLTVGPFSVVQLPGISHLAVSVPFPFVDTSAPGWDASPNAVFGLLRESPPFDGQFGFDATEDLLLNLTIFDEHTGPVSDTLRVPATYSQFLDGMPLAVGPHTPLTTALWHADEWLLATDFDRLDALDLGSWVGPWAQPTVHGLRPGSTDSLLVLVPCIDGLARPVLLDRSQDCLELSPTQPLPVLIGGLPLDPGYESSFAPPTFQLVNDSLVLTLREPLFGSDLDTLRAVLLDTLAFRTNPNSDPLVADLLPVGGRPAVLHPDTVLVLVDRDGYDPGDLVTGQTVARIVGTATPRSGTLGVDLEAPVPAYLKHAPSSWLVPVDRSTAAFLAPTTSGFAPDTLVVVHASDLSQATVAVGYAASQWRPVPVLTGGGGGVVVVGAATVANLGEELFLVDTTRGEERVVAQVALPARIAGPPVHLGGDEPLIACVSADTSATGVQAYLSFVQFLPEPMQPQVWSWELPGLPMSPAPYVVGHEHLALFLAGPDLTVGTADDQVALFPLPVSLKDQARVRDVASHIVTDGTGLALSAQFVVHTSCVDQVDDLALRSLVIRTASDTLFTGTDLPLRFSPTGNRFLNVMEQTIASYDFNSPTIPEDSLVFIETVLGVSHAFGSFESAKSEQSFVRSSGSEKWD